MAFTRQPPWLARILNARNRTAGTGFAVDREHVITCGHLEPFTDPDRTVALEFPFARREATADVVHHVFDPAHDGAADLAVLKLHRPLPDAPHLPLHRAIRFSGRKARLRGFPDERESVSPIADVELSEFSRPGWVQINPTGPRGWSVHDGFSGGPVWDESVGAVIGMVVAKHGGDTGHLLTLDYLCELWPGLAEHIRMPPTTEGADSSHWWPRARGLQRETETVWRFRGRRKAIGEIAAVLGRDRADGPPQRRKPLIVTGTPGVGKSATLARVVTTSYRPWLDRLPVGDDEPKSVLGSVDCAVHAQGKSALEVAQAIALRAGIHDLAELTQFPTVMREALDGRDRFGVVIDAVDEALDAAQAEAVLAEVITPLAEFPAARIVAGSRRYLGTRRLLATGYSDFDLLDLDEDRYFELADLESYALATLRLEGEERQGNPYTDRRIAEPVAREIARRSAGNFLVAGLIARAHGRYDAAAVSPGELTFTGKVDDAFRAYLSRLPRFDGVEAEQLLTALAFAEAPGFTVELWASALKALDGVAIDPLRLEAFARSGAASFLIEQSGGAGSNYRLFHQALIDALRYNRTRGETAQSKVCESRLTGAFLAAARRTGWDAAPEYLYRSLIVHAANADLVDELLLDPEFLIHADPSSVLSHVTRAENPTARLHAAVFRAASWRLDPTDTRQRRALLAYNARRFEASDLVERLAGALVDGEQLDWRPRFACGSGVDDRLHTTIARSWTLRHLECADIGDRSVAVTCETIRGWGESKTDTVKYVHTVWDVGSGKRLREQATEDEVVNRFRAQSPQCAQLVWFEVDEVTIAVTHNHNARKKSTVDMCLSVVPVGQLDWRESFDAGISSRVGAFAATDGGEVLGLVTTEPSRGELWNLSTGRRVGEPVDFGLDFRRLFPNTFTILDGNPVVAVLGQFEAELWDLAAHRRIDRQGSRDPQAPPPVECGKLGNRVVAVDFLWDATAIVWDLVTGEPIGRPLAGVLDNENLGEAGRANRFRKVAFIDTGDGPVVSFHTETRVLSWDIHTGAKIGAGLDAVDARYLASASTRLDGRPITVAASRDGKLQVWDVKSDKPPDRTLDRHTTVIADVAAVEQGGDDVVLTVSKSPENKVRLWNLTTGRAERQVKTHPTQPLAAVVGLPTQGRDSIVVAAPTGLLQEWSLPSLRDLRESVLSTGRTGTTNATAMLVDRDRLYLLSDCRGPHEVWVFDRPPGEVPDQVEGGAEFALRSVDLLSADRETFAQCAVVMVRGRAIAVVGTREGSVRLYDLESREELRRGIESGFEPLYGGPGTVRALAFTKVDGRELLFIGRDTGDVHVTDFATGQRLATLPFNDPVTALDTFSDGRLVVASGRELSVFRYRT